MARSGYDVLTGLPGKLPYDIQTKQMSLKRKRQLFEAMQAQSLAEDPATIKAGGIDIPNWASPIGKVAKAFFSAKELKALDKEEDDVALDYNNRVGEGTKKYLETRDGGAPVESAGPPTAEGVFPPPGVSKPNPRQAIFEGFASGLQPVQEMAKLDQAEMGKNRVTSKDVLGNDAFTADSRKAAALLLQQGDTEGALAVLDGKRNVKVVDGNVVDVSPVEGGTGAPVNAGYAGSKFGEIETGPGGIPVQKNLASNKATGISGGNVTPPGAQVPRHLQGVFGEELKKGYEQANKSVNALQMVANAQSVLTKIPPHKLGIASDLVLNLNKVAEAIGFKPVEATANVEAIKFSLGRNLLDYVRLLAPVTDFDYEQMKQIIGSNTNTPAAISAAMEYAAQVAARDVNKHNELVERIQKIPGWEEASAMYVPVQLSGEGALRALERPGTTQPQRLKFDAQGNQVQ
jgi:hypothetical protein